MSPTMSDHNQNEVEWPKDLEYILEFIKSDSISAPNHPALSVRDKKNINNCYSNGRISKTPLSMDVYHIGAAINIEYRIT